MCIIACLMCLTDRLLQYTFISLSFLLLSLSLSLNPLMKLCLWFFSFSTALASSSSLQKCISLSPPPSLVSLQRQNTTLYWPFHAKTTFRRCFHLIYTQSLSTRRDLQEQFDVFWRIWFSMLSSSRFFVLLTAAPLAMTARHYATEDKNSLGFSSLGRINITSRYVTCCYGDGLTVLFTEKRRWFGGQQREGMQSIHSVWWAAERYHKASTLILSMKQQVSREKEGAMGKTGSTERQKKKGVLNLRILKR